jgi:hypothetical protein
VWEKLAPRHDQDIQFWERVQFGDGQEWVWSSATGDVQGGRAFCLAGAGIGLEETAEPTLVAQALPNQLRGSWRRLSRHGAAGSSS